MSTWGSAEDAHVLDLLQDVARSLFDNHDRAGQSLGPGGNPVPFAKVRATKFGGRMKIAHLAGASLVLLAAAACSDRAVVTEPLVTSNGLVASLDKGGTTDRTVSMMDACDGPSFTAMGILCTRNGGVSFGDLFGQLAAQGFAGAWHNAPSQMDAKVGLTLLAVNRGGEAHTFTKVAKFGGGFVPEINAVLHLTPTPECLAENNVILPGGTDADDVVQPGTTLYQCCIHPWMRTVVNGKG